MYSLKTKIRTVLASVVAVPLLCGMMSLQAYAQSTTQKINLDNVTVFLRGAELFNSGSVRLPAGESEVVFTNVAGRINEQSLSISASNGVMVLSSGIRNDYLVDENLSPKAQEIQKELDAVKAEREGLQIQLSVIQEQLAVLEANRQLAQSDGRISAAEIGKMLDLISTRMTAALKQQVQLNLDVSKLDERIGKLEQQLDEERNKGYQPGGQVVVKFYAPQATTSQVRMSYVVNDAGWVPAYDLHVPKVGAPVNVTYKANVFQNTGINWDKVNLTLSTGNPSQGVQVPTLRPWHIAVARPQPVSTAATSRGTVSREYSPLQLESTAMPAEAPTTALYGRIQTNALDGYVTTNAQGVNTSFDIAIPYTVPTDGKGHMILIQSAQVPASYQYVATPKLDQDVFLQARLTDWQNLNLLPGTTNVYFENSFIGQGRIDLNNIKEGLDVSLGRDKRIIVERVEDQNNRGTAGLFGGSAQRTFAYTFNIRNTRSEAVQLVIKDQLPVSRDSEVTLNDLKLAGGVHDDKTGEVKWTLSLKAGEQRNITYSYVVRYPKDANITGL